MPTRTLGTLVTEARTLLSDKIPTSGGAFRYTDAELFENINCFFAEIKAKRPDLYLDIGLRQPVPVYDANVDMNTPFPLDSSVYSATVYYVCGRAELREDTFSDDSRAVSMMNKAVSQLMQVVS